MKIDVAGARARAGSRYPKPFDEPCRNKTQRRLVLAVGLTQFGVNLLELGPGAWSSQRHWHAHDDEFVYIDRGPVVLVTDGGSTPAIAPASRPGSAMVITCRTAVRRPPWSLAWSWRSAPGVRASPMPNIPISTCA